MADSLVLTGVKDIKKQTGTEMVRRFPKRGGDVFSLKRWWVEGGVSTVNTNATVFDVTTGAGTVKLAVESTMSTNIRIEHDGSFNFTFYGINEVGRAALFTETFDLIEHYVFPTISGGQVMTVTPSGGASRPSPAPAKTFTAVTLTGDDTADENDVVTYTAGKTGTATDVDYVLTSDDGSDSIVDLEVTFGDAGDRTLTLIGSSAEVGTQKSDTLDVTVSVP